MDNNLYEQEGLRQLTNRKYYTEIQESICADTVDRINKILTHLNDIGFINDDQYTHLWALVPAEPDRSTSSPKSTMTGPNGHTQTCRKADLLWPTADRRQNGSVILSISFLNRSPTITPATSKIMAPKSTRRCPPRYWRCYGSIH